MGYNDAPEGWWQEFVAATPARTAKLAIVRKDGSPHVAPVWVELDGDDIVFMTSADTVKGKAILRDPRVSLCFDDERPPFSFVSIAGTASLSTDPDERAEIERGMEQVASRIEADMDPYVAARQLDTDEIVALSELRQYLSALVEMSYQATGARRIKNPRIWSLHDLDVLAGGAA